MAGALLKLSRELLNNVLSASMVGIVDFAVGGLFLGGCRFLGFSRRLFINLARRLLNGNDTVVVNRGASS